MQPSVTASQSLSFCVDEEERMKSAGHFRVMTHINCSEIFIEISDLIKDFKEQQQL